jgi:hypothetical protein
MSDYVDESRRDIDSPQVERARHYWRVGTWILLGVLTFLVFTHPKSFTASAGTLQTDDSRLATGTTIGLVTGV